MLIRFSSPAAGSITMFGDIAIELIGMMGASGRVPGAIAAADVTAASVRLRHRLDAIGIAPQTEPNRPAEETPEPTVGLATRAVPLLQLLQRAGAANAPVMWETG